MNTIKRKKSRIPKFRSYEEEANWWDTHDTTEFEDEFKPVKLEFANPLEHILGVRLDVKTIDQLAEMGSKVGIGPSTLARMWIMERLNRLNNRKIKTPTKSESQTPSAILHKISKPRSKRP